MLTIFLLMFHKSNSCHQAYQKNEEASIMDKEEGRDKEVTVLNSAKETD